VADLVPPDLAGVAWVFLAFDNVRDFGGLRLFAEAVMPES